MKRIKLNIQKFASGTIGGSTSGYFTSQIVWYSNSNGSSANSSNVTASLQIRRTNSYTTTGTVPYSLNINGNNYNGSWNGSFSSGWVEIANRTVTVGHNNDGTKVCNIYGSATGPSGTSLSGNTTVANADVGLDNIARWASMTGASNFNDESNPSFSFSNPANTSLSCWIEPNPVGEHLAVRTINSTGGTYTWNLTEEERNKLRSKCTTSNNCVCRIGLYSTLNGSTVATYRDVTFSIVNANPIFNDFEFEDVNTTTVSLTGNNKKNINGYSNIKITISDTNKALGVKGATINKYRFVIDNQTLDIPYSDNESVNGIIQGSTSGTYNVYAIDSRNNSTLVTKLANEVINYTPIIINTSSKIDRNNGGVGINGILNYSGEFWNGNFGNETNNIINTEYEYKETGSNAWITFEDFEEAGVTPTDILPSISNNGFSFNNIIKSIDGNNSYGFNIEKSYDFRIKLSDKLSNKVFQLTPMASGKPNISFADDGVGIMCDYDESLGGELQVGGKIISTSKLLWTNSNPSSNFTAQNVNLLYSDWDLYEVIYSANNSSSTLMSSKSIKGSGCKLNSKVDSNNICDREIQYRSQELLSINNAFVNNATRNECLIPLYIIGYKTGLFD